MYQLLPYLIYTGLFLSVVALMFLYSIYKVGDEKIFNEVEKPEEKEYEILEEEQENEEIEELQTAYELKQLEKKKIEEENKQKKDKIKEENKKGRQVFDEIKLDLNEKEDEEDENIEFVVKYYEPSKYEKETTEDEEDKKEEDPKKKLEKRIETYTTKDDGLDEEIG